MDFLVDSVPRSSFIIVDPKYFIAKAQKIKQQQVIYQ